MMEYLSELVHAQLEHRKPENIPIGIHLEHIEAIAHRSHMDYMFLSALLKLEQEEEKKSRIKSFVIPSAMMSLAQVCCLKELEDRFEKEGIYHLILKGSVLKGLYPSPELREMSDIDVMIYDENLIRAKKVVEDMGFTFHESIKHHEIYKKLPWLIIELHHELYDKGVDKNQYEYFKNKKQLKVKEGRKYALQFETEDFYVYLIAHMAKHFFETGCGIRNLVDVYIYRQHYEATWNEAALAAELEKCGLTTFESRIHTLAKVWLGGQKPDYFSCLLFDYMVDCGIYGKGENGIWGQFAMLNKDNNNSNKSYAKRWYYFPPRSYLERDYAWLKKYPFLIVIAWGIRGVHGLLHKDGRNRRKMLMNIKNEDVSVMNEIYKGMQLSFRKD